MQAGKKLDEWVAEKVFGWERKGDRWFDPSEEAEATFRPFSTDISAAWTIVDLICQRGFRLRLEGSKIWRAQFYKSAAHTLETHAFASTGSDAAEAICLAALAVKGVELPK